MSWIKSRFHLGSGTWMNLVAPKAVWKAAGGQVRVAGIMGRHDATAMS
jgi:hypothetical protein